MLFPIEPEYVLDYYDESGFVDEFFFAWPDAPFSADGVREIFSELDYHYGELLSIDDIDNLFCEYETFEDLCDECGLDAGELDEDELYGELDGMPFSYVGLENGHYLTIA